MGKSHDIRATIMSTSQVELTLVNFWHTMGGLYMWEYLITFDYEWQVIRGRLPYRWTIWIYSLARLAALMSVIINLVTMDVTSQVNCQFWVIFSAILLLMSSTISSLLIVLRTVTIWNRNLVLTLAIIVWGTITALHLHNITLIRSTWLSSQLGCVPAKSSASALGYTLTMIADIALLLIILAGLLVLRRRSAGTSGLTRVLWKQGIIWLAIAFAAEIPLLVFTILHIDDQLHSLFVSPTHIITTIAATRMHRALVGFNSSTSDVIHESHGRPPTRHQVSSLVLSKAKPTDTPSAALDGVEVSIHIDVETASDKQNDQ